LYVRKQKLANLKIAFSRPLAQTFHTLEFWPAEADEAESRWDYWSKSLSSKKRRQNCIASGHHLVWRLWSQSTEITKVSLIENLSYDSSAKKYAFFSWLGWRISVTVNFFQLFTRRGCVVVGSIEEVRISRIARLPKKILLWKRDQAIILVC
jgi:hypothetical protein